MTTRQLDSADPDGCGDTSAASPLVVAEGLALRTKQGPVFGELDFTWPESGMIAVTGAAGVGRSSLLLAVTGRMRGLTGRLSVAGIDAIRQSRQVRAITSVARISHLVDLEGQLTVGECITERALIDAVAPQEAERLFAKTEKRLGLDLSRRRLVDELPALDRTLLAAVLATLRLSRLVVLDDADARIDLADQRRLYEALRGICADGPAIAVSVTEVAALPEDVPRLNLLRPDRSSSSKPPESGSTPAAKD